MGTSIVAGHLLWYKRISKFDYAMGALLYTLAVLGHERLSTSRRSWSMSPIPSVIPRSEILAKAISARSTGTTDATRYTARLPAFRSRGHGLRRNAEQRRPPSRSAWTMVCPRRLELERACQKGLDLRAVRKILMSTLGDDVIRGEMRHLLFYIDNQAGFYITNSMVSANAGLMRELRQAKVLLDRIGICIRAEWFTSALNRFADALSRRSPRGYLQTWRQLRRSVVARLKAPIDTFKFHQLEEPPWFVRRQVYKELAAHWMQKEVRLLCPPIDLLNATVMTLARTKAPAMLINPHWPRQGWHQAAIRMASKVTILSLSANEIWIGQRRVNQAWKALLLEVNLDKPDHPPESI